MSNTADVHENIWDCKSIWSAEVRKYEHVAALLNGGRGGGVRITSGGEKFQIQVFDLNSGICLNCNFSGRDEIWTYEARF